MTRLNVWVKSRTKKDGTAVNTDAAEKIVNRCFFILLASDFYFTVKLLEQNSNIFRKRRMSLFRLMIIQDHHHQTQNKTLLLRS